MSSILFLCKYCEKIHSFNFLVKFCVIYLCFFLTFIVKYIFFFTFKSFSQLLKGIKLSRLKNFRKANVNNGKKLFPERLHRLYLLVLFVYNVNSSEMPQTVIFEVTKLYRLNPRPPLCRGGLHESPAITLLAYEFHT